MLKKIIVLLISQIVFCINSDVYVSDPVCSACAYNVKTSWLGYGWPNVWYPYGRRLDVFGREGRYFTNLYNGVYNNHSNYNNYSNYGGYTQAASGHFSGQGVNTQGIYVRGHQPTGSTWGRGYYETSGIPTNRVGNLI